MVIVEPVNSSRVALPDARRLGETGELGRRLPQIERLGMTHHRHHQPVRGLGRDADMDAAMTVQNAGLVVEARVDLRMIND